MAGLFGFTAPSTTDFTGAAEATAAGNAIANNQATTANRPTQNTPWGSSTWSQDANGNWTQNIGLSQPMQSTWNNLQTQMGANTANPLDTSGFTQLYNPGAPTGSTANASWSAVPQIQQAMLATMQPQFDNQQQAEIARLKAQGITEGSEAWNNSMDTLGRQQNDINMKALLAGSDAANTQFQNQLALDTSNWNQKTGYSTLTGSQRAQQLQEAQTLRDLPQSELNSMSTQLNSTFPGFSQAGAITGPNYLGASELTTRQNNNVTNANNANNANTWNALLNLGNLGYQIWNGP